MKRAIGTTDSLLASGGAEASRGPISSRINAQCYPNLQAATAAAIRANQPLWVPAGTYRLTRELVIDYAPLAHSGLQVISDGAVIDATATGQPALTIRCSGGTADNPKACFYFHIRGTLFVNANTAGPAVRFGRDDFSEAHNSARIEHLAVNDAGTGYAVELNYVLNADIFAVAVTAGSAGLVMNQVQFSHISGAASATAGTAMLIQNGYSFANTIQAIDLEVAEIGIAITSPYANRNTFVSPYINCPTPIVATAGYNNLLINPSYGGAAPPAVAGLVGVVSMP